jgi:predicted 3-demethylubiquinone-9 3-methyltransferase (glyoxalase superfamily)
MSMAIQQKIESSSKIVPHLWFDTEAVEATRFYASLFPNSRVDRVTPIPADTPSGPAGSVEVIELTLFGQRFMAINAGPLFRFNPSISFMVNFDPLFFGAPESRDREARRKIDEVWEKLSDGGKALMPLDRYPFSERYGWVEDRYGLSWQLILTNSEGEPRPPIVPSLLFTEQNAGRAEEAIDFYVSVFKSSRRGSLNRYGADQFPEKEGTIAFADFMLEDQWFAAMDSAREHGFVFNEAISLMVYCEDQKDIDYYWNKLSAVPQAEQCGWLKDRFGVSWQIVPKVLDEMMKDADKGSARRAMEAMLQMKKLDIAALERAFAAPKARREKERKH